ncbi:MAG TPA: AraC family transcriptional regulator [Pyrinomonadaceae bacterium]|jgi:AraC family transcriptional regulator|nr:AraC family transcriptional regulator [Pyrinomonadaceae bacterium]
MQYSSNVLSPQPPVRFKKKAAWEGLRLEHCGLTSGDLPEHCHQEHTVLIALSDSSHGELNTSSGTHLTGPRKKGSVCVLPSGMAHTASLEGESEHLALYLDPLLVQRAAADAHVKGNVQVVERCYNGDRVISTIGTALLAELNNEGLGGRLYVESLANVLAVHLLRHYTDSPKIESRFVGGLSGQKLRQVKKFIAENYSNDLRLNDLAEQAGMSSFHFAREFKKSTGTSPHQYLIKFRVDQAKTLLANSDLPLTEVGLQSGFSHQSHFTRLFHKLTGTTPQSYRHLVHPVQA